MIDYSRHPRPESIAFFEKAMHGHKKVNNVKKIENYYYQICRCDMSSINVVVTNFYTLGYGELLDILEEYPDVNCVITISNWNGYTNQAYDEGKKRNVGVFKFEEFMGAINIERPCAYIRPSDKECNSVVRRRIGI